MENSDRLNRQLYNLYWEYWPNLIEYFEEINATKFGLSYPLLLYVFPGYTMARFRLMIIGKSTAGWTRYGEDLGDDPIRKLMKEYEAFRLGLGKTVDNPLSPFWCVVRYIYSRLNPDAPSLGFVWNNIIKVDQERDNVSREPEEDIAENVCRVFPVLPREIEILRPDVVIFMMGRRFFTKWANICLGKVKLGKHSKYGRELELIRNRHLPRLSFRINHPAYYCFTPREYYTNDRRKIWCLIKILNAMFNYIEKKQHK